MDPMQLAIFYMGGAILVFIICVPVFLWLKDVGQWRGPR
jgi:hypothetical protein